MEIDDQREFYIKEDLRQVAQSEHGKRFLNRLFKRTSLNKSLFTNNGHTAYKLGQKSIGDDYFYSLMDLDKDLFSKVLFADKEDKILILENNTDEDEGESL